jgi:hypothetical protein
VRTGVEKSVKGALLLGSLAFAIRLLPGPRTIDDAFITFRYARNIVNGLGFVYNEGQRVQGTTTPLYTLLIAALSIAFSTQNHPWLSLLLNAICDSISAALLYKLGEKLSDNPSVGLFTSLLFAFSPMSVTFAIGGMETSIYILLILSTFYLYCIGKTRLSVASCALAVLTRPDALLVALPLFGHMAISLRRVPWREALLFVILLAPWVIFATLYFGSPLANSIVAKSAAYRLHPMSAFVRLIQHYSVPFFEHRLFGRFWPAFGFPLYLALYAIGSLNLTRRNGRSIPLVLYPLFYFIAFSCAKVLIFRWYLAPPLPPYFLGIVQGLWAVTRDIKEAFKRPKLEAIFCFLALALLAFELNAWEISPDDGPRRPAPEMAWIKLEELYKEVALELRGEVGASTLIASGDIGVIGYYTDARILDTVGLVSPEVLSYYPLDPSLYVINYAISPDLVEDYSPDYLVTMEVYVRNGLLKSPSFLRNYRLIKSLETDIYGSRGILVFKRVV